MRPWQAFARLYAAVQGKARVGITILLLGMIGLMPTMARANECPDMAITVASGATYQFPVPACSPFGADGIATQPSHGSASVGSNDASITYINNGDSATSDHFAWYDDEGEAIGVTVTISSSAPTPITLTPSGAQSGTVGQSLSIQFSASGGNGGPYTYQISQGVLPAGLSDDANGLISGTPTESGTFNFTETASDGTESGSANITLTINGGSISISPASGSLPSATAYQAYSETLSASGGTAPYTYSQVPGTAPPSGISIGSSGTISGTATALGSTNFSVKVTDSTGASTQVNYTLQVVAPTITLSPNSVPSAIQNNAYSQTVTAGGGSAPYTFDITSGSLPAGMSFSSGGVLSGTPTVTGNFSFTARATDAHGFTGSQAYTLTVNAITVPGAPTGASATPGDAQATVSFAPPANNGGATITGYTATSSPGGFTGTCASSPCTVTGLTNGTAYTFTVTATNSVGTGPASAASNSVTPKASQTITFNNPGTQNFGTSPTLSAHASSNLTVTFSSSTTGVCTVTSGGVLTFITAGTCTINADQAGNAAYSAAPTVSQSFSVAAVVPGAPIIGTATPGDTQVSVSFSPPPLNGGAAITMYTATANPGGATNTCAASPCVVTGLTNGTAYTFTVTATNSAGTGPASAASNSATPAAAQVITFNNPGTQNFGTSPTLTATASSGLTVSFTSSTTAVCTITSGGALTTVSAGTCTINANQAGNSAYQPAPQVSQSFAIAAVIPGAPTIGTPTAGDAQVSVAFAPPGFTGGAPITSYTATATPGNVTGTCASSPCVVANLTNGTAYTFTVTATNSAGTGAPSAQSISVTPKASQTITFNNPGAQNFGASPTLTATASSGLPVTFSSSTTAVCTITSGGVLTTVTTGTCTINANQAGNGTYQAAPQVAQSFAIGGVVPGAPIIGIANAGDAQASVTFTPPASNGGNAITSYTATSSPGGVTGTCAASPCTVTGLINGTAYTFTVTATNGVGTGAASAASNSVTPKGNQTITFNNPGTQNFGTSPTLTATASSGLAVTFSSSTPAVCTITSGGVLTTVTTGTCTINANQAGNGAYQAATQVTQSFAIGGIAPGAPTIGTATAGDAQASVTFTPPTSNGGDAITSYTATSSPGGVTGTCTASPCTVTGLTNGTAYTFTVTATNAAGTGAASAASNSVTPKAVGVITNFVATPAQPVFKPSGTFTVSATGDGSSSPVVFAVASSSASVCSIQGTTVTTLSAGICTLTANEAGDASHTTAAQVMLAVTITNPPPPVVSDVTASTNYNTAATINLGSAIAGIDVTSVAIAKAPAHGTATLSGQSVTYTPSSTFYGGTDSFTYTASNPGGTSSPATVTVTVTPSAVPTAQAHTVATTAGTPVTVQAETGASGPQPFTGIGVATQPAHGSAVVSGEQITYTPAVGFTGTDTFTYTVSNHFGNSQPATITITVTKAGSATGHTTTVLTTPGTAVSVNLASVAPGTYTSASLLGLSPGSAGNVVLSQPSALTFTPTGNFLGLVQITAVLTSSTGDPVTVDVLVLVSKQPDPSRNPDVLGLINAQTTDAEVFAQSQLNNIRGRLESLHDGGGSLFSNTLSLSLDGRPMHGTGVDGTGNNAPWPGTGMMRPGMGAAESMGDATASPDTTGGKHSDNTMKGPQGLGVWIGGTASFGSFDAYRQAAGFDSDNIAITAGVDQRLNEQGLVGLSLGYNHDNSDIANSGTHNIAQGFNAAVYGSFEPSTHTYLDGVLGGGGLDFSSRRYDQDTATYLLGHRNGDQWFASLTGGYEYKWNNWLLSPYGRLEWSLSRLNSFSESGVATGALTYGNELVRTSQTILGIRASGQVKESFGLLIPHFRFEFGHDFQGASSSTLSYAFIPSAGSWNVLSNPYSANGNSLQIGFGSDLQLQGDWMITTDYDYLAQPHSHDQMIRVGVKKQF